MGNFMSKLTDAQHEFVIAFSELMFIAEALGFKIAYSDGYRDEQCNKGHHPSSLHTLRLAHDLILRSQDGKKVLGAPAHNILHDKWDVLGGAKRIKNDTGHYSWPWGRVR